MAELNETLIRELVRTSAVTTEVARRQTVKFNTYFPDCVPGVCRLGSLDPDDHVKDPKIALPICRILYTKQVQFMDAGGIIDPDTGSYKFRERMFLAANRIGKTVAAAYEVVVHMTGLYPKWWQGRKFDRPVTCWAAGDTMETTRNVPQVELLGPYANVDIQQWDQGLVPDWLLMGQPTRRSGGVARCIDAFAVKHWNQETKSVDGQSTLQFKSYDQGRRSFQGTEIDITWLDEEPPEDVYAECLTRTLTTTGLVLCTFTPLQGMTEFLTNYMKTAIMADANTGEYKPANDIFWPEAA